MGEKKRKKKKKKKKQQQQQACTLRFLKYVSSFSRKNENS
jgi:hypothetical protein